MKKKENLKLVGYRLTSQNIETIKKASIETGLSNSRILREVFSKDINIIINLIKN